MIMNQQTEIEREILRLAQIIDAPDEFLPTIGRVGHPEKPHVEVSNHEFHYVKTERGEELSRQTTSDRSELIYWILSDVTFRMSVRAYLGSKNPSQDPRRTFFRHQVLLLSKLSDAWGERERQRHVEILRKRPFDDNTHRRVEQYESLRREGFSHADAWRSATKQYPKPEAE